MNADQLKTLKPGDRFYAIRPNTSGREDLYEVIRVTAKTIYTTGGKRWHRETGLAYAWSPHTISRNA